MSRGGGGMIRFILERRVTLLHLWWQGVCSGWCIYGVCSKKVSMCVQMFVSSFCAFIVLKFKGYGVRMNMLVESIISWVV